MKPGNKIISFKTLLPLLLISRHIHIWKISLFLQKQIILLDEKITFTYRFSHPRHYLKIKDLFGMLMSINEGLIQNPDRKIVRNHTFLLVIYCIFFPKTYSFLLNIFLLPYWHFLCDPSCFSQCLHDTFFHIMCSMKHTYTIMTHWIFWDNCCSNIEGKSKMVLNPNIRQSSEETAQGTMRANFFIGWTVVSAKGHHVFKGRILILRYRRPM